jgi:hypothetical protein
MNTPIPQEGEEDLIVQLPSDLYIPILENINDRAVLAKVCLVDRLFLELARERMYDFVWVRPCELWSLSLICLVFADVGQGNQARIPKYVLPRKIWTTYLIGICPVPSALPYIE